LRAAFHAKDMNHAHRMDQKAVPDISENPSKLSQKKLVSQKCFCNIYNMNLLQSPFTVLYCKFLIVFVSLDTNYDGKLHLKKRKIPFIYFFSNIYSVSFKFFQTEFGVP
jgi:hypothetical protein